MNKFEKKIKATKRHYQTTPYDHQKIRGEIFKTSLTFNILQDYDLSKKIIVDIGDKKTTNKAGSDEAIKFNDRELEIIQLLSNGLDTKEVANKISLSTRTIDAYRSKLLSKTGTKNSIGLVMYAIKNGLVKI